MKIATKIRVNYLFMVALILLIGVLGHREVTRIGGEFNRAINRTQPVVAALQEIRFHAMHLTALAHGHRRSDPVRTENAPAAPPAAGVYPPAADALGAAGERYRGLVSRYFPAEVKYADPIREAISELQSIAREMEQLPEHLPAGDRAPGQLTLQRLDAAVNRLLAVTERSLAAESEEVLAYRLGIDSAVAEHGQAVLAGTATVMFAGLLVGLYLSRRLSQPIVALRDVAVGIGAGNLHLRAAAHGKDEFGELAHAFNEMAHTLSRTMISHRHVEIIIDCMGDGVLVANSAGVVQRANQAARDLLAGLGRDLIGAPLADLLPGTGTWLADLGNPAAPRTRETELPVDAGSRRVRLRASQMWDAGQAVGIVVTLADICDCTGEAAVATGLVA